MSTVSTVLYVKRQLILDNHSKYPSIVILLKINTCKDIWSNCIREQLAQADVGAMHQSIGQRDYIPISWQLTSAEWQNKSVKQFSLGLTSSSASRQNKKPLTLSEHGTKILSPFSQGIRMEVDDKKTEYLKGRIY